MIDNILVEKLQEMITQCFTANRYMDRICSVLNCDFAMCNTSELLHLNVAHYYPILADKIGEKCLERYNISILYGETPSGNASYENFKDTISDALVVSNDIVNKMQECIELAQNTRTYFIVSELLELLNDVNKIREQLILLDDKANQYLNCAEFDKDVKTFWSL